MNATNEPGPRQKTLVVALFLILGAIVLVSLACRIANPSLFASRVPPPVEPAPAMSSIGQLMNDAARDPKNPDTLLRVAESLLAQGQNGAAGEFARRALAVEPNNARALHLLGVAAHQEGKHAEAAGFLEKSAASQDSPAARYSLGVLYLHFLKDREKGIENFKKGLALPNIPESLKKALQEELEKAEGGKEQPR